ncbi:hypothetical protein K8P10_001480 [Leucobacter sp. Psy1]|uniref:hypothetical protein n=1 Tax=Leucobacter sp. Psy1 TaxID=2875729 RepID=UPI001CD506CE|nr:hypothetical protein [Leucobacter sp. Psy1]UBH05969.1 hypothetical protein K8P10_001480 [Leucobacter sp. Psy1]
MTLPLPDPPALDRLPPTIVHAALMRGDLVRCGPGVRPVGWPDSPRVRAHALSGRLTHGRIASHLTAAWVWGAARRTGPALYATVPDRRRREPTRDAGLTLTHRPCPERDRVRFGAIAVTTPRRTLIDLIHDAATDGEPEFPLPSLIACRVLAAGIPGGVRTIPDHELRSGRSTSLRRIAERLARL